MPEARRTAPVNHAATLWPASPEFSSAVLTRSGWSARHIERLTQTLVSGDLDAAKRLAPDAVEAGLWTVVKASVHRLRIARDRALIVAKARKPVETGWCADGFATSDASDLYKVFEIEGQQLEQLIVEATSAPIHGGSPSAAIFFAGIPALLYRIADDTARLHVDASQATALWAWLQTRPE